MLFAGMSGWVYHRAVSCMIFNRKTGRREGRSRRIWKWLGDSSFQGLTDVTVHKQRDVMKARGTRLLWAVRHGRYMSIKIRHKTFHSYYHDFRIYLKARTLFIVQDVKSSNYQNRNNTADRLLQFDVSSLKGRYVLKAGETMLTTIVL